MDTDRHSRLTWCQTTVSQLESQILELEQINQNLLERVKKLMNDAIEKISLVRSKEMEARDSVRTYTPQTFNQKSHKEGEE